MGIFFGKGALLQAKKTCVEPVMWLRGLIARCFSGCFCGSVIVFARIRNAFMVWLYVYFYVVLIKFLHVNNVLSVCYEKYFHWRTLGQAHKQKVCSVPAQGMDKRKKEGLALFLNSVVQVVSF